MTSSMSGYRGANGGNSGSMIPKGYKQGQIQRFTPEMMQLYQQMMQNVGPDSFTSKLAGGDQSAFDEMEAPAMRQFSELLGGLSSRFSGQGSYGSRRSSGFQNATTSAASNFAQELQSKRTELRNQAIRDLMSMSGQILNQNPYEQFLEKQQPKRSFWDKIIGGGSGLVGGALGGFYGGPAGAYAGFNMGNEFAKGFQG